MLRSKVCAQYWIICPLDVWGPNFFYRLYPFKPHYLFWDELSQLCTRVTSVSPSRLPVMAVLSRRAVCCPARLLWWEILRAPNTPPAFCWVHPWEQLPWITDLHLGVDLHPHSSPRITDLHLGVGFHPHSSNTVGLKLWTNPPGKLGRFSLYSWRQI